MSLRQFLEVLQKKPGGSAQGLEGVSNYQLEIKMSNWIVLF